MNEDMFKRMRRRPLEDDSHQPRRLSQGSPIPKSKPQVIAEPRSQAIVEAKPVVKKKRQRTKKIWPFLSIVLGVLLLISVGTGSVLYYKNLQSRKSKTNLFGQQISQQVSIPVYYPQNLPAGYTYNNDAKTLATNVLYFSVTGPGGNKFFVTQEAVPAKFDFSVFNNKFLNADNFSADAGSVIAGNVGNNLLGSVRTNLNSWILVNSQSTTGDAFNQLEAVIRSLVPANNANN